MDIGSQGDLDKVNRNCARFVPSCRSRALWHFDGFAHQTIGNSMYNCFKLDELVAKRVWEFAFTLQPLKI